MSSRKSHKWKHWCSKHQRKAMEDLCTDAWSEANRKLAEELHWKQTQEILFKERSE